jgi:hypothetical protein
MVCLPYGCLGKSSCIEISAREIVLAFRNHLTNAFHYLNVVVKTGKYCFIVSARELFRPTDTPMFLLGPMNSIFPARRRVSSSRYGFARLKLDSDGSRTSQFDLGPLADDLLCCNKNESSCLICIPKMPIPGKSVLVGILIQVAYRIKSDF